YLDDLRVWTDGPITSETLEIHWQVVKLVLAELTHLGFYINGDKLIFEASKIPTGGMITGYNGIRV
ncbi:hypothetical protein M427DRAFT_85843, partial [Gonapodya prolifera JEL478]